MTYASTSASFTGRTNAGTAVSQPSHVFRSRKRDASPTFCIRRPTFFVFSPFRSGPTDALVGCLEVENARLKRSRLCRT